MNSVEDDSTGCCTRACVWQWAPVNYVGGNEPPSSNVIRMMPWLIIDTP